MKTACTLIVFGPSTFSMVLLNNEAKELNMKKIVFLMALLLSSLSLLSQESFMIKTETRYWDNSRTYNGYTLFGTRGTSYLLDFEGHVIHTWNIGTNPRFTEAGTLLDAVGGNPSNQNTWKELDWDGTNDNGMRVEDGLYVYVLMADNRMLSKKMIRIN